MIFQVGLSDCGSDFCRVDLFDVVIFRWSLAQERLNEAVNVAIHDPLNIRGLVAGAMIFNHCVGLENIAPNLPAPSGGPLIAL